MLLSRRLVRPAADDDLINELVRKNESIFSSHGVFKILLNYLF